MIWVIFKHCGGKYLKLRKMNNIENHGQKEQRGQNCFVHNVYFVHFVCFVEFVVVGFFVMFVSTYFRILAKHPIVLLVVQSRFWALDTSGDQMWLM